MDGNLEAVAALGVRRGERVSSRPTTGFAHLAARNGTPLWAARGGCRPDSCHGTARCVVTNEPPKEPAGAIRVGVHRAVAKASRPELPLELREFRQKFVVGPRLVGHASSSERSRVQDATHRRDFDCVRLHVAWMRLTSPIPALRGCSAPPRLPAQPLLRAGGGSWRLPQISPLFATTRSVGGVCVPRLSQYIADRVDDVAGVCGH